jgi:hypothetical protein
LYILICSITKIFNWNLRDIYDLIGDIIKAVLYPNPCYNEGILNVQYLQLCACT